MPMLKKDFKSDTWGRLVSVLLESRESLREQLESAALSHEKTLVLRGELRAIRTLLALDESADPATAPGSRKGNQDDDAPE